MTTAKCEPGSRPRFSSTRDAQAKAYSVVARAIEFLRKNPHSQPRLTDVAAHVELSTSHLQRIFADWAGISPKRFLQVATVSRARRALAESDLLGASLDLGLSSPSRLHDLVVSCEAATPAELRDGGEGLEVRWGITPTALGPTIVGTTRRGVCHLGFVDDATAEDPLDGLRSNWPRARLLRDDRSAEEVAECVFGDADRLRPLHLLVKGTNFQVQVWRALLRIRSGSTATYGAIARSLHRPTAARAVAGAVARNRIAILIPCHRVLREDGALGGYRWGCARKVAALVRETADSTD